MSIPMNKYYASVREIDGKHMPVLITGRLDGKWIPPLSVYLAIDVEPRIAELEKFVREVKEVADKRWFTGYRGEYNDDDMIGLSTQAKALLGLETE